MFDRLRELVLRLLRVPPAPEPPLGAPDSVRVFRAGRNFFKLCLARWFLTQVGAVVGILISLGFLAWFRAEVLASRSDPPRSTIVAPAATVPAASPSGPALPSRVRHAAGENRQSFHFLARRTPDWALILLEVIEVGGVLLFLVQLPVTFAAVRLDFELHWYIVTDRSLRIRTGLLRLQESTMSFANLQQVEIKQGPLQRLLGLADLRVQSAGGSSSPQEQRPGQESLHTGVFHSVENAADIRDLILDRLRKFRETGLGDPDDHGHHPGLAAPASPGEALAAAQELLTEARALRSVLTTNFR